MIRVRTTLVARIHTETFRVSHWVVFSRIVIFVRLGMCIVHCAWEIQSVLFEELLRYSTRLSEAFTAADSALFRRKVATCLGTMLPGCVGDAAFRAAWKEVQAFAWQKHSLSELVSDVEGWKWHDWIADLQQALLVDEARNLTEAEINEMIVGLLEDPDSP
jgi:hypothetical protein